MPLLFSQISHNKTQVSLLLWSILHHLLIWRTCVVMLLHGFTEKDCKIFQPSFNSSQAGQDRHRLSRSSWAVQWQNRGCTGWLLLLIYMAHIRHYLHSFIHYVNIFSTDINVTMNSELDIEFWYHMLFDNTFVFLLAVPHFSFQATNPACWLCQVRSAAGWVTALPQAHGPVFVQLNSICYCNVGVAGTIS